MAQSGWNPDPNQTYSLVLIGEIMESFLSCRWWFLCWQRWSMNEMLYCHLKVDEDDVDSSDFGLLITSSSRSNLLGRWRCNSSSDWRRNPSISEYWGIECQSATDRPQSCEQPITLMARGEPPQPSTTICNHQTQFNHLGRQYVTASGTKFWLSWPHA